MPGQQLDALPANPSLMQWAFQQKSVLQVTSADGTVLSETTPVPGSRRAAAGVPGPHVPPREPPRPVAVGDAMRRLHQRRPR